MLSFPHLSQVFDTIAAKIKTIVAKDIPTGLFSTKFVAIGAAVGVGVWLFWGQQAVVLDILKWGVQTYCVFRIIETVVSQLCQTYIQGLTIKHAVPASTVPATPATTGTPT
jgi:hypothetical protein